MKKKITIIFNCHGYQILLNLKNSKIFNNDFNEPVYFSNYNYIEKDFNNEELKIIYDSDVIITQYINDIEKKYIYHERIIKLLKKNSTVIIIPNYNFNGYLNNDKIVLPDTFNINKDENELNEILNNITIDINKIKNNLNNSLNNFKLLDNNSTIKMYDYVFENYKKYRLFNSYLYPSDFFFYELSSKILNYLNYLSDIKFINFNFAHNVRYPILPFVKKILELNFEEKHFIYNDIKIKIIYYYLYVKLYNDSFFFCFYENKNKFNKLLLFTELIQNFN